MTDDGDKTCLCREHSGLQERVKNIETKVCNQVKKMDQIYARVNIVLGSACLSLFLIILDIVLRTHKIK